MSNIFEEGEDDYTMEDVLSQAKDLYPAPEKTRPILSLCDRVLHDQSEELQKTMRTNLELRATLDFVEETHPPPGC